jgi:hypothetical protein
VSSPTGRPRSLACPLVRLDHRTNVIETGHRQGAARQPPQPEASPERGALMRQEKLYAQAG